MIGLVVHFFRYFLFGVYLASWIWWFKSSAKFLHISSLLLSPCETHDDYLSCYSWIPDTLHIFSPIFFSFWCSDWIISSHLLLNSLTLFSVISILLFSIFREIFILVVIFLILIFTFGFSLYVIFAETFHPSIHVKNVCPYFLEQCYNRYFSLCQIIPESMPFQSGYLLSMFSHAMWDFPISFYMV